jgi:hypothetical protein
MRNARTSSSGGTDAMCEGRSGKAAAVAAQQPRYARGSHGPKCAVVVGPTLRLLEHRGRCVVEVHGHARMIRAYCVPRTVSSWRFFHTLLPPIALGNSAVTFR